MNIRVIAISLSFPIGQAPNGVSTVQNEVTGEQSDVVSTVAFAQSLLAHAPGQEPPPPPEPFTVLESKPAAAESDTVHVGFAAFAEQA